MLDQFTTDELQSALHGAQVGIWSWDAGSDTLRWSSRVGEIYGFEPTDYPRNIEAFSTLLASADQDLRLQIFYRISGFRSSTGSPAFHFL